MTQLVLQISRQGFGGLSQAIAHSGRQLGIQAPTREIIVLGSILAFLQVCDGVLTGIGMGLFGHSAEGNILLRMLMEQWGTVPALVAAKGFSILVIGVLCMLSTMVSWIPQALKGVIAVYLFAAVLPWTAILLSGTL